MAPKINQPPKKTEQGGHAPQPYPYQPPTGQYSRPWRGAKEAGVEDIMAKITDHHSGRGDGGIGGSPTDPLFRFFK